MAKIILTFQFLLFIRQLITVVPRIGTWIETIKRNNIMAKAPTKPVKNVPKGQKTPAKGQKPFPFAPKGKKQAAC